MSAIWPAGRALPALVVVLSLTRPSAAYWFSKRCYVDALGIERCEGLSYGAGAGIGVAIICAVFFLIVVIACINRPRPTDIEEVWVTQIHPAGIPAPIPPFRDGQRAPPSRTPPEVFQPDFNPHIIGEASPSPRTAASQRPSALLPTQGRPGEPNEKAYGVGGSPTWQEIQLKTPRTPRVFVSDPQGKSKEAGSQLC